MDQRDLMKMGTAGLAAGAAATLLACDKQPTDSEQPHAGHDRSPHSAHMATSGAKNGSLVAAAAACIQAGDVCLQHCITLLSSGNTSMAGCAKQVSRMLSVCRALSTMAAAGSAHLGDMIKVCRAVCRDCEAECRKHASHHAQCKAHVRRCWRSYLPRDGSEVRKARCLTGRVCTRLADNITVTPKRPQLARKHLPFAITILSACSQQTDPSTKRSPVPSHQSSPSPAKTSSSNTAGPATSHRGGCARICQKPFAGGAHRDIVGLSATKDCYQACERRLRDDNRACALNHDELDKVVDCLGALPSRRGANIPRPAHCDKMLTHQVKLLARSMRGGADSQTLKYARTRCLRFGTQSEVDCVLAATTRAELARCKDAGM